MTKTQSKTGYTPGPWEAWDADAQITLEEHIASMIFSFEEGEETPISEEGAQELAKNIALSLMKHFPVLAQAPAMAEALRDALVQLRQWYSTYVTHGDGTEPDTKRSIERLERVLHDAGIDI